MCAHERGAAAMEDKQVAMKVRDSFTVMVQWSVTVTVTMMVSFALISPLWGLTSIV